MTLFATLRESRLGVGLFDSTHRMEIQRRASDASPANVGQAARLLFIALVHPALAAARRTSLPTAKVSVGMSGAGAIIDPSRSGECPLYAGLLPLYPQ